MAHRPPRSTYEELLALVAEPRDRVAALEADNARLRADLDVAPGETAAPTTGAGGEVAAASPA